MAKTAAEKHEETQNGQAQEEAVSAPTVALARRSVLQPARMDYDPRQVGLLKDLAPGAPEATFNQFLELAARYELDPFMGQIWLARMQGENAQAGGWVVMVGRDGLLALANRDPSFKGLRSGVVYSSDDFEVWEDESGETKLTHRRKFVEKRDQKNEPVIDAETGTPVKTRGKLLGAWALVYREGRLPTFWFAEYEQYLPKSQAKRDKGPWSQYDDAMIAKCAQSTGLRLSFSITGLVVAEEVSTRVLTSGGSTADPGIPWGDDAHQNARLMALFQRANEIEPGTWLPKKIAVELHGKTHEEREALAERVEGWIVEHHGEVPEVPVPAEAEDVQEADFEVIDPPGDDPEQINLS